MFGIDRVTSLVGNKSESEDEKQSTELIEQEAPSKEVVEKHLKKLNLIFDDVEDWLRNKRVSVDHRDDIVEAQHELLKLVSDQLIQIELAQLQLKQHQLHLAKQLLDNLCLVNHQLRLNLYPHPGPKPQDYPLLH